MENMKFVNYCLTGIGLFILLGAVIFTLNKSQAVGLIVVIPISILGAALFISGYIGVALDMKE